MSRAEDLLREGLRLFEVAGDPQGRVWTLQRFSEAARFRGLKEQVELLEDVGDAWGRSTVALDLAVLQQCGRSPVEGESLSRKNGWRLLELLARDLRREAGG